MKYEDRKARRVEFTPPLPIRQKLDKYAPQNERGKFILDAVTEKIRNIEAAQKSLNSVSHLLG
jgi:hypothetical protein